MEEFGEDIKSESVTNFEKVVDYLGIAKPVIA